MDASIESRRLLWRCRRGMKELDVVLERFAKTHLAQMSSDQKHAFEQFLDLPDPQLVAYLLGYETPSDPDFARLTQLIAHPGA